MAAEDKYELFREEGDKEEEKEEEKEVVVPVRADGVISWVAKKLGGAFTGGWALTLQS